MRIFRQIFLGALLSAFAGGAHAVAETANGKVEAVLSVIRSLDRPGRITLATVWDDNKYVQCRRASDNSLTCEAGGAEMQPSLQHILTAERIGRLAAMGWMMDQSFGNYVQTFKSERSSHDIAGKILDALSHGYDADLDSLQVETTSVVDEPCPPRRGPSQNLAGLINDAPLMASSAVHVCTLERANDEPTHKLGPDATAADLIALYGPTATTEIERLRLNMNRSVFVIFDTDLGYVQCRPETDPDSFYCEAKSADSWPALAALLTPDRIARLHAAGFADPGRGPNYGKTYKADAITDSALASEILTVLHDSYGYYGASKLQMNTEEQ